MENHALIAAISKIDALVYHSTINRLTPVQEKELDTAISAALFELSGDSFISKKLGRIVELARMHLADIVAQRKPTVRNELLEECRSLLRALRN